MITVKSNQPQLLADVQRLFDDKQARVPRTVRHTDTGHGRIETRTLHISQGLEGHRPVPEFLDWPQVQQALRLERTVQSKKGTRSEVSYAITSLSAAQVKDADLLCLWRGHWSIENRLHWVRDVTFGEDLCQVRTGSGPQVLAILRNAAISLLRLTGQKNLAAALRRNAARPEEVVALVGAKLKRT